MVDRLTDDTTTSQIMSAIARSDLIKHQDQILKQLPRGNTIENVISGDIFRGKVKVVENWVAPQEEVEVISLQKNLQEF